MTTRFKALVACVLLPLLCSTAQSQRNGPGNEKELERQRLRLHAISMINQSASEAPLWNHKKAAVQAFTDAADLLWDQDPGQGARWLRKAWDLMDQVSDAPQDERMKQFTTRSDRSDLRSAVLRVARKHDQQLVEWFLKQLSQKTPDEKKERGALDDRNARSEQLLGLAWQAVETDPGLAFSLAQASLTDGLSHNLQGLLTALRTKNVPLSNQLFDLALARFNVGQPDPSEAEVLAGYLFHTAMSFSANSTGHRILVVNPLQQSVPPAALSEPQRARGFLAAVYQKILARPISVETSADKQTAQSILSLGNGLVQEYNTFTPDLAPAAQGFLTQLRRQLSPTGDQIGDSSATSRTKPDEESTKRLTEDELYDKYIDELEEAADKESSATFKRMAYLKAAVATEREDYKRGKRIAEKIDDDDLRADAISFLLYRAALLYLSSAFPERAVELAPQISNGPRRAVLKIAMAQNLLQASTTPKPEGTDLSLTQQRAFDLLNDIDRDLSKEEPSVRMAKILFGRAAVLAKMDKAQALTALEQAVQMMNKLDQFDLGDRAAPQLGLAALPTSSATLETPDIGFDFRSAIAPLINTHFEEVASVVERITSKEVAGAGRIEAAKLFLQKSSAELHR